MSSFDPPRAWWKQSVVYQIWPSSFKDSNGDGVGDLNGIFTKLDYLKELGVDVIWLNPIYPSPKADMGYDVSDYCDIHPQYGTLTDWDNLLQGAHERGMKIVMDIVANHSSDEHEWFKQSRADKTNQKRGWYFWRPPKYDAQGNRRPPNNWKSRFQGSAWQYDETTDEYYLHLYHVKQPDLNWENPAVRAAIHDVMRFWINRGCDGFRMDAVNLISKAPGLPDAPVVVPDQEFQDAVIHYANRPRVHEFIKELNKEVISQHDLFIVGEISSTHSAEILAPYVLPSNKEFQMAFPTELMDIDSATRYGKGNSHFNVYPLRLTEFKSVINKWQTLKREEGFWNSVFLENHDTGRSVSRFGDDSDEWRRVSAKMLAILQTSLSGTLFIYQGEELGMKNFPNTWGLNEYKDVASLDYYTRILQERKNATGVDEPDMSDVMKDLAKKARDHARTPMQWDDSSQAGFTTGTPWMRVNDDYLNCNAASQLEDPESVLLFWKRAISIRKSHDVLIYGDFTDLCPENEQKFVIRRTLGISTALILLNFSSNITALDTNVAGFDLILSNYAVGHGAEQSDLRGWEGRVYIQLGV